VVSQLPIPDTNARGARLYVGKIEEIIR